LLSKFFFQKLLKWLRHLWRGHIIRHKEFAVNILEGAISGKKAVGRPRLQYLTLCRSYSKPYCMGRKNAFFPAVI
jgi:hypothetical protein